MKFFIFLLVWTVVAIDDASAEVFSKDKSVGNVKLNKYSQKLLLNILNEERAVIGINNEKLSWDKNLENKVATTGFATIKHGGNGFAALDLIGIDQEMSGCAKVIRRLKDDCNSKLTGNNTEAFNCRQYEQIISARNFRVGCRIFVDNSRLGNFQSRLICFFEKSNQSEESHDPLQDDTTVKHLACNTGSQKVTRREDEILHFVDQNAEMVLLYRLVHSTRKNTMFTISPDTLINHGYINKGSIGNVSIVEKPSICKDFVSQLVPLEEFFDKYKSNYFYTNDQMLASTYERPGHYCKKTKRYSRRQVAFVPQFNGDCMARIVVHHLTDRMNRDFFTTNETEIPDLINNSRYKYIKEAFYVWS